MNISDIRLTSKQTDKQDRFYQELLKAGVSQSQALQAAQILIQDEVLGLEARTPMQQSLMRTLSQKLGSK